MQNDKGAIRKLLQETLPFWSKLDQNESDIILNNTYGQIYSKNEEIRTPDTTCLGGFVVLSGVVRIYIMSEEGRKVTIMRLHAGETCFLGAGCVLHSIAFDVFMEAEDDTKCLIISPSALKRVFETNLEVENFVLNSLIQRFSDVMWTMQQILFMSMDRRLAIFLYEEAARTKSTKIALTQEQIAEAVGSAREVVSRMLRYFSSEGITKNYRGGIEILDMTRLKKLALQG